MHELSIAQNIVEIVSAAAAAAGAARVVSIHLRVGALTGIVPDALHFCFDLAAEGTLAAGAGVTITPAPAVIHCSRCLCDRTLDSTQSFVCPVCGEPAFALVSGRELQVTAIEIPDSAEASDAPVVPGEASMDRDREIEHVDAYS